MIIPPIADKSMTVQNTTIRSQWLTAAKWLHNAGRVFILGYSLPATDLMVRFWLTEAADKDIIVVNCDEQVRTHFPGMLGDRFTFHFGYVGGTDCISRLVADLTR